MERKYKYKVVFKAEGFDPEKDISEMDYDAIKEIFVAMYNLFCSGFNSGIKQINEIWEKYEETKKIDTFGIGTMLMDRIIGLEIGKEHTYSEYITKMMKEYTDAVDMSFAWAPIRSYIFKDEELPHYGVEFKDHPEWKLSIVLEEA